MSGLHGFAPDSPMGREIAKAEEWWASRPLRIDQWLTFVLDQIVEHWSGSDLAKDPVAKADVARALAEKRIVEAHIAHMWDGNGDYCKTCPGHWPCSTIRWLAYGHKFDAQGWQDEWLPCDAGPADRPL